MTGLGKFGLGTVQWGLPYGIANPNGVVSPETVKKLLSAASHVGIEVLDTASLYGEAEAVLGENPLDGFKVVTKTPSFAGECVTDADVDVLNATFHRSLDYLRVTNVHGLLIHHANNLLLPGGEKLISAMVKLKEDGLVKKIGVSVYDSKQVDSVLKLFTPDLVQLPLNVFDQRMLESGHVELLKNSGVEIHVRSVFLQGLLLMPMSYVPKYFQPISPLITRWHDAARSQGFTTHQAAIAFVKNIPYVDTVLVGLDSVAQFNSCVDSFSIDKQFDASGLACNAPAFVNPSLWKLQ
jgi:aryl-alcohol dehydrogenase-like predicted oxidoreductase